MLKPNSKLKPKKDIVRDNFKKGYLQAVKDFQLKKFKKYPISSILQDGKPIVGYFVPKKLLDKILEVDL